ncbi:hypothetical protein M409DRAFT_22589 [Zasmidium cellare ATCC 36951]|uniref:F-box domain-containing protein n=1 Tax=Zasmidium cellare ATCC 36951 TaxID=1080233 RepID=A0A6A6CJE0_ZASCE|nr:uncharacterized protein M409DRAFT_22589 [Zasmidium cellare ATCC 36951]KAF2167161.1 hypothetical protein M409DRAFT_22589 [Zasmidium cellare ATCC 36951]
MVGAKRSASSAPDRRMNSKKPRVNVFSSHGMLTRGITTAMTRNAVLNTSELLVGILQYLHISDLVAFRRVNKYFKATIDSSPQLQINMFLRSTTSCKRFWLYNHATASVYPYVRGDAQRYGDKWVVGHSVMRPSTLNPLLFKTDEEERRPPLKCRARNCESIRFTQRPDVSRSKQDSIFHRMFICQPPVAFVEFQITYNPNKSSRRRAIDGWRYPDLPIRGKVRNKKGVTFGDLMKKIREEIKERTPEYLPSSGFRIHVSDKRQSRLSQVWMLGAILVSEEEKKVVEGDVEDPRRVSPLAEKMRKPEFLRDEAEDIKKSHGCWSRGDYEFAGDPEMSEEIRVKYEDGGVQMDI